MRSSRLRQRLAGWALVLPATLASANQLGVVGPVYPIAEENAVDTILRKLKAKERSGELRQLQQAAIKRSVASAKNPKPVDGLSVVVERSERLIDPTVTYAKSITTDDGKIVVPAGAKINPLLITKLTKRLVFFDGRDRAQSEAVRKMVSVGGARVKPILVAGSWFDTSKAWQTQVYYDQSGVLSKRFGIRAVPSVISQQETFLLLQEVPAKELR